MFWSGQNCLGTCKTISTTILQTFHISSAKLRDQLRIFAEAFIGPSPTDILHYSYDRSKVPADTCGSHLNGSCLADLLDQRRVIGCSKANIVRKDCSTVQVAVTMHCIHPIEERNP